MVNRNSLRGRKAKIESSVVDLFEVMALSKSQVEIREWHLRLKLEPEMKVLELN